MEVFLTLGLLLVLIWLWNQREGIRRLNYELLEARAQIESWTTWSHGFFRNATAVHQQVESLAKRIEVLERTRLAVPVAMPEAAVAPQNVIEPQKANEVAEAAPRVEVQRVIAALKPIAAPVSSAADEVVGRSVSEVEAPAAALLQRPAPQAPVSQAPAPEAPAAATEATPRHREPSVRPAASHVYEPEPQSKPRFDWESLIGVRLFSWIAGLSLVLGAVFFLRYSAENGWLSPSIRMAMGFLVGIALLVVCEFKGRDYRITANAMDAAGIGVLFSTSFAGHAVWHLIPATVAFLLLILVTAVAVLLSIRRQSLFIALLGLVGGYATPVLLSTGENRPIGLFGYLLLLNVGLGLLGYRQRWPILLCLSIGLTTLYQWGWVGKFVVGDAAQLPTAVGVFLLFPLVWVAMNRLWQQRQMDDVPEWVSETLSWATALPLILALAMSWIPAFGQRFLLMFGYLLVLDLGLIALNLARPRDRIANVAAVATWLVWIGWLLRGYDSVAWPVVTLLLAVFVLLFLVARVVQSRLGLAPSPARFAAVGLLLAFAILALVEPAAASPYLLFGVLFGLVAAIAAVAIFYRDGWLYYATVPFVILAQACWSSKWLNEQQLIASLVVYVVFALLFIAVPLLARRFSRPFEPAGLTTVVAPLNLTVLLFLSFGAVAPRSLWMIGILLVVLNVGAFIEARHNGKHLAAFAGIGLSWLIVVAWWHSAIAPERLLSGLVVVLALVLLSVGGILWINHVDAETDADPLLDQGPLLGLVGHLFLLYVATQPTLNHPPWSLFAIMLVLDLALVAASLYLGRALFAAAGLALTVLVLGVWAAAIDVEYTPLNVAELGLSGVLVVAAIAVALPLLARRRQVKLGPFMWGQNVTLLLGQAALIELGALSEPPRLFALVLGQLLLMVLVLRSAGASGLHRIVFISWALACLTELSWGAVHLDPSRWSQLVALALVPYGLLTLYPSYCRRCGKVGRWPFVAAICGALGFFVAGYAAMQVSPLRGYLGALPLAESLMMAALLLYLLKVVEPGPPRDIGRLALVAAVALGFATTAVPLQLENEWLTIAWALESAVVAWLYHRLRHTGLIAASLALAAAVTIRLVANPEVLIYHARSTTPIFNFYLYTYLVSAISLYIASWFLGNPKEPWLTWLNRTGYVQRAGATVLLFVLLNIEIADFHSEGEGIVFRFSSTIAQDLSYTLGWAAFAIGLLVAGIWLKGRAARIAALLLLTVTIAKCFLHDLWRLGGLYRVGSFVGLALCLALVAIMLQRFVLKTPNSERP